MLEPVQFFSDDPFQDHNQEVKNKTVRLANESFLFLILFLAKAKSIILFAPVSASGGAFGGAIHHLLVSLAASVPVEFVLVGGTVQGATPMQRRGCVA